MPSYHQLALVYDEAMNHINYHHWTNFLIKILEKERLKTRKIVDLGCGTGEITIQLAKKGFHMIGVDISSHMLSVASQKSIDGNLPVLWLQQDIKKLTGFANESLFISFFDVMNYITAKDDLLDTFQNVYDGLEVGGYFIFDVHHIVHVNKRLIGNSFSFTSDEFAYIWDCTKGDKTGEMDHHITFFVKTTDQYYERFTETHHQKTLEIEQYEEMLKNIGFSKIEFYSDFKIENTILRNEAERIFIVAKK